MRSNRAVAAIAVGLLCGGILVACSDGWNVPPKDERVAGWNEGEFAVSDDGVATYRLPLWVPEGRGGLKPELTLSYSSSGGNGPLGVGWSLQGGSTISKCARTIAQDGYRDSIRFDGYGPYCLDGNRLVPVMNAPRNRPGGLPTHRLPGEYGVDPEATEQKVIEPDCIQREFRTERDVYAKIVAYCTPTGGRDYYRPSGAFEYFRVWTKDGRVLTFGEWDEKDRARMWAVQLTEGPDPLTSTLEPAENPLVPVAWSLNRIEDRNGNAITFQYWSGLDSTNLWAADMSLQAIRYEPDRVIRFFYEERPDTMDGFVGGVHTRATGRLSRIQIFDAPDGGRSKLLREYRLKYEPSTATISGRSLLSSIEECVDRGGDEATHGNVDDPLKLPTPKISSMLARIGGEGTHDESLDQQAVFDQPLDGAAACLAPLEFQWSRGAADFDLLPEAIDAGKPSQFFPADVNGDGREDVVYLNSTENRWLVRFRTASGYSLPQAAGLPPLNSEMWAAHPPRTVDINRDGRMDVLAPGPRTDSRGDEQLYIYRSHGGSFQRLPGLLDDEVALCGRSPEIADLNADGLPDVVSIDSHSGCGPFFPPGDFYGGPLVYWTNDGRFSPGLLDFHHDGPEVSISGHDFVLDRDGDGRDELLAPFNQWATDESIGGQLWSYGLDRSGTPVKRPTNLRLWRLEDGAFDWHAPPFAADVNGDGLTDVVWRNTWEWPPRFSVQLNSGRGFSSMLGHPREEDRSHPDHTASEILEGDFSFDNRIDFLTFPRRNGAVKQLELVIWQDSGFVRRFIDVPVEAQTLDGWPSTKTFDADGDGVLDLMLTDGDQLRILKGRGDIPDLMIGISVGEVGPRVEVDYTTLADVSVHKRGQCEYPQVCLTHGRHIVAEHRVATGSDAGWIPFTHDYAAARADLLGRGWLGFAAHTFTNELTGAATTTSFDNITRDVGSTALYPYARLPLRSTVTVQTDGDTIYRLLAVNTYTFRRTAPAGTYVVELTSRAEHESERPIGGARDNNADDQLIAPLLPDVDVHDPPDELAPVSQWPPPFRSKLSSFTYDDFGNVTTWTTDVPGGRSVVREDIYQNDSDSWLIGALRRHTVTGCSPQGECRARVTTFDYDDIGNLDETTVEPSDPLLRLHTVIGHTPFGAVSSVTSSDSAGHERKWLFTHSEGGTMIEAVTDSLGHTVKFEVDEGLGVQLAITDANGGTRSMSYDGFGRLKQISTPDGNRVNIAFLNDSPGTPMQIKMTYADGYARVLGLDQLGREHLRRERGFDGEWSSTSTEYDALGRVSAVSRPYVGITPTAVTHFSYDGLGRLTTRLEPDGATVQHTYAGLTTDTRDAEGVHSSITETPSGEIATRDEPHPEHAGTHFEYGAFGELTKAVAVDGTEQSMGYDTLGRRTSHTDPDAGATTSAFNAFGEIVDQWDAEGRHTHIDYDEAGRPVTITSDDGVATFQWDTAPHGLGLLDFATSSDGVVTRYAYDELARPIATTWEIEGEQFEVGVDYDEFGRLERVLYPEVQGRGRLAIEYGYNEFGYLFKVADAFSGSAYWTVRARTEAGQMEEEGLGNGLTTTWEHDPATGLLQRILTVDSESGQAVQDLSYTYDPNRNVSSRADAVGNREETYTYDTLNRLQDWSAFDGGALVKQVAYSYSDFGDLENEVVGVGPGSDVVYRYGEDGAPPHALTSRGADRFTYDGIGRQITGPDRKVDYNTFNLPRAIQHNDLTIEFAYDAEGARVHEHSPQETVVSIPGLYERRTGSDVRHVHHIVADGRTVAQITSRQDSIGGSVTPISEEFLHGDLQGTVSRVSNDAGQVTAESLYDPFGLPVDATAAPFPNAAADDVRPGYTGHQHDDQLGLIDMVGRIYDPGQRRFLTPDPFIASPLHGQNYNRYSYVLNNPATFSDPTGFQCESAGGPNCDSDSLRWDPVGVATGLLDLFGSSGGSSTSSSGSSVAEERGEIIQGQGVASGPGSNGFVAFFSEWIISEVPPSAVIPFVKDSILANHFEFTPPGQNPYQHWHDTIGRRWSATGARKTTYWFNKGIQVAGGGVAGMGAVISGGRGVAALGRGATTFGTAAGYKAAAATSGRAIVDAGKYDYLFGKVASNAHNQARSAQNARQLARIGVYDNALGRSLLQGHFDDVVARTDNILGTIPTEYGMLQIRESVFVGPGGFLHFRSGWQVTDAGLRLTTVIPRGGP